MRFSLSVLNLVTKSNLIKSMFFNLPIILPPISALAVYVNRETFSLFSNFFRAICNPRSLTYFFFCRDYNSNYRPNHPNVNKQINSFIVFRGYFIWTYNLKKPYINYCNNIIIIIFIKDLV